MGDALIISPPVAIVNSAPGLPRADGDQLVDHILEQVRNTAALHTPTN